MKKGVLTVEEGAISAEDIERIESITDYIVVKVKTGRRADVVIWPMEEEPKEESI